MNQHSENSNQPDRHQWHMKKEINLAHLITTVVLLVSGFWFLGDLDKKSDLNTQSIQHTQQDIKYIREQRKEDLNRIESHFKTINSKLDDLLSSQ